MSSDQALSTGQRGIAFLQKADTALSTDFCPWANKYVYWLKNPFWVLVLAIAGSVACGVFLNPLVFILTGLLIVVTTIGVLLPWIAVRGISCSVAFDVPRTRVGSPAIVRLTVRNQWPIPVWGLSLIRGFARDVTTDSDEGVALARVPGWSTIESSWPFEPRHRGIYPDETAEVETGFPFGLFRARKAAAVDGQIIVWPKTVGLKGMPDASDSRQTEEQFSERRVGEFGDMMGTRPFRTGDSLRRVHWAQTARQQTLIVTERQAPAMTSVRVVLDLSEVAHPPDTRETTVELCVQTAASICESLHQQHSRVELVFGRDVFVAGDAAAGFHRMMDALAVAELTPESSSRLSRRHGFEILVTTSHGVQIGRAHQVVIGDEAGDAWISISDFSDLTDRLPSLWRRVCHAS